MVTAGSTKGLVSIKPVKYFKEDAALVADTVTAEVEINAASSATSREGLDLVVVLDISESMSDEDRIGKMKKAMHFVIMKLTPVDRLSICAFSNVAARYSALLSMTPAGQSSLMALVDNFAAGGGTYIEGGLACGLAVITNRVHTVGRTANIFLMSDGQESIGNARQVDLGDVPVYTFGFGKDTDHQVAT
jgi:Mg-chelatase subunit ChlD